MHSHHHTLATFLVKDAGSVSVDVAHRGLFEQGIQDELVLPWNGVGNNVPSLLYSLVKILLC